MDMGSSFCVLCRSGILVTHGHLFFHCPFSKACWCFVNIPPTPPGRLERGFFKDPQLQLTV